MLNKIIEILEKHYGKRLSQRTFCNTIFIAKEIYTLTDRTATIKEIIKNIEEYCVLDALPDKDSDFEKGMHYAGNGLVKLLKDKLSRADQS